MKTFFVVAVALAVVAMVAGQEKKECFKPECPVGKDPFNIALPDCMARNEEANEAGAKTYACMFKRLGADEKSTAQQLLALMKPCVNEGVNIEPAAKDCLDKIGVTAFAVCLEEKLNNACSDDDKYADMPATPKPE